MKNFKYPQPRSFKAMRKKKKDFSKHCIPWKKCLSSMLVCLMRNFLS